MKCAVATRAERSDEMISEEGNRRDFKRCFLDSVEHRQYPCGHVYIYLYAESVLETDFVPVYCPWCPSERRVFSAQRGETTYTMEVAVTKPCEIINVSFHIP